MRFRNLFDLLASSPFRNPPGGTRRVLSRRRPAATGLQLEALEDRCLPSFLPAVSYPVGVNPATVVTGPSCPPGEAAARATEPSIVLSGFL